MVCVWIQSEGAVDDVVQPVHDLQDPQDMSNEVGRELKIPDKEDSCQPSNPKAMDATHSPRIEEQELPHFPAGQKPSSSESRSSTDDRIVTSTTDASDSPLSPSQAGVLDEGDWDNLLSGGTSSKPKSSQELLKYVLETAQEGSLKNLTDIVHMDPNKNLIIGRGGFSDVYKGSAPVSGKDTVLKLFRLHCEGLDGVKNFAKELRVVSRLRHPNVLTPLGYVVRGDEQYYIVSERMERGTLRLCMATLSVRELFDMSVGIARAITYLHENGIVHGDIKSDNVLVSSSGTPLLTDFGLSRMTESYISRGFYSTETPRGSTRWLAYEYYVNDESEPFRLNPKTDVWAFGMTVLELLTGDIPYAHVRSDNRVILDIATGKLPDKPKIEDLDPAADLKRFMWSICLKCWTKDPKDRPSMRNILEEMSSFAAGSNSS